jgi:hypothetical protein
MDSLTNEKTIKYIGNLEKDLPIANIPVMLKSKYCSTHIKSDLHGECKYDPGGYFIVKGAEKAILSMEKMADNKVFIFNKKDSTYPDGSIYTAQINSKSNDWSDNLQILTMKNRKDGVIILSTATQLVDIQLFVLMRALGIESDMQIISYITYDLQDNKMLNLLTASMNNCVDDNGVPIRTKTDAINYLIGKLRKNKRISQTSEELALQQRMMQLEKVLRVDLLPHLNEDIPKKIMFLGFMANKLLNVILGRSPLDDRDALQNKRIETPGILLAQLFRQNWRKLLNEIGKNFKKKNQSDELPINVVSQLKPSTIEQGFKTALSTGTWGMNKTKRGVAQSLQRLSWYQGTSYLRRVISPSMDESTAKVTSIRQVNNNQCQLLCCLTGDTEILLSNRIDSKYIKDITNFDEVMTINPFTLKETTSGIYNKFSKMPDKLLKIRTISGRDIKVTLDHKLLVNENGALIWKESQNLNSNDKLIIKHVEKIIELESNKSIDYIIKSESIKDNKYKEILIDKMYINNIISDYKLSIFSRILGYVNSLSGNLIHLHNNDSSISYEYLLIVNF